MNNTIRKIGFRGLGLVALALALSGASLAQSAGRNAVTIRGQQQDVYYYPATGARLNRKVLFAPGDGGWRGWAITVAQQMTSWGYDVYGLDTKTYLSGFTGSTPLKDTDVISDFKEIAKWVTKGSGERVMLVGWSEGAGLDVLAAGGDPGRRVFTGLITFGLVDENVLGWSWRDNLTYVTSSKPSGPKFHVVNYIGRVPALLMIQSSKDEYVTMDEVNKLYAAARGQKRLAVIQANDHRFSNNTAEFYKTLRDGLQGMR